MSASYRTKKYWDRYYQGKSAGNIPSQFATFVLSEFFDVEKIIDVGCGDGRDAFFFNQSGKKVLGLDGSDSAIDTCIRYAANAAIGDPQFKTVNFSDSKDCEAFSVTHRDEWSGSIIYARFFLHAISADAQRNFLQLASQLIGSAGRICLEFRTDRDERQVKETEDHYRRFVKPMDFANDASDLGLKIDYFCEGFGMAKYKNDDAHVARFVLANQC
jgi:SAM-dependent methyltransferase